MMIKHLIVHMTEEKTQGIVLKLIDYKDANKLASIFTFHNGITTAKFTGIKKEKAKLKAVAQPFVLADFSLSQSGTNKTVVGANIIDNFYQILTSYNKTMCGYIVLDVLKTLLPENQPEQDLFLITVATLKNIEIYNEYVATIDFILKFLTFSGVGVQFTDTDYVFLDKSSGDFTTKKTLHSVEIDKKVYAALKEIAENIDLCLSINLNSQTDEEINNLMMPQSQNTQQKITTNVNFNLTTLKQALRLLGNIIYIRLNAEIKSLHFI